MATTMVLAVGIGSAAVATLTTRSRSPPRSKHHRPAASAQEESDDAATAYSSWIEDDSPGLTSPCLSFRLSRDEDEDDDDDDDRRSRMPSPRHSPDDNDDRPSRLPSPCYSLLCYSRTVSEGEDAEDDGSLSLLRRQMSFCSSFSGEDVVDAPSEPHPAAVSRDDFGESAVASLLAGDDGFVELVERAQRMLQKESEHEICDYFHQGDPPSPTGVGDSSSPVDAGCRSKMMEWSFRVLEYSFPHTPSPTSPRKHSVEAIQTVSQAFNLVDRLSTLRFRQGGGRAMNRSEYKLICMICLHLVAKTCGLFRLYDSEKKMEEGRTPSCCEVKGEQQMMCEEEGDDLPRGNHVGRNSASSPRLAPSWSREESQTINHTLSLSCKSSQDNPRKSITVNDDVTRPGRTERARPPLDLLSLSALCTLCQNEFSLDRLIRAERNALESLDWELAGATSIEWHRLLMELLALARGRAIEEDVAVYRAGRDERRNAGDMIAEVGECSLADLEAAMEASPATAPSAAARTAFARALDECDAGGRATQRAISIYNAMVRTLMSPSFGKDETRDERRR